MTGQVSRVGDRSVAVDQNAWVDRDGPGRAVRQFERAARQRHAGRQVGRLRPLHIAARRRADRSGYPGSVRQHDIPAILGHNGTINGSAVDGQDAGAQGQIAQNGHAGEFVAGAAARADGAAGAVEQLAANDRSASEEDLVQGGIDRAAGIVDDAAHGDAVAGPLDGAENAVAVQRNRGIGGDDRAGALPAVSALAEIERAALDVNQPVVVERSVKVQRAARAADRAVSAIGPGLRVSIPIVIVLRPLDRQRRANARRQQTVVGEVRRIDRQGLACNVRGDGALVVQRLRLVGPPPAIPGGGIRRVSDRAIAAHHNARIDGDCPPGRAVRQFKGAPRQRHAGRQVRRSLPLHDAARRRADGAGDVDTAGQHDIPAGRGGHVADHLAAGDDQLAAVHGQTVLHGDILEGAALRQAAAVGDRAAQDGAEAQPAPDRAGAEIKRLAGVVQDAIQRQRAAAEADAVKALQRRAAFDDQRPAGADSDAAGVVERRAAGDVQHAAADVDAAGVVEGAVVVIQPAGADIDRPGVDQRVAGVVGVVRPVPITEEVGAAADIGGEAAAQGQRVAAVGAEARDEGVAVIAAEVQRRIVQRLAVQQRDAAVVGV